MRGYLAFLRKELGEAVAGRRLAVMAALFCGLGMASPFLARYTSEILAALGSGVSASAPRTAADAWGAFFNNASGLGLSITLILWAGVVSQEVSRGTLLLMVTRGLPRPAVVMAKWTSAVACFTACWWPGCALASFYIGTLWPGEAVPGALAAAGAAWVAGVMCLGVLVLGSCLFRQPFAAVVLAGAVVAALSLASAAGPLAPLSPARLLSGAAIAAGEVSAGSLVPPLVAATAVCAVALAGAVAAFSRRRL